MAQATLNTSVTVILELTEDEAVWLKYHTKNFHGENEDELPRDQEIRHNLFMALKSLLPAK